MKQTVRHASGPNANVQFLAQVIDVLAPHVGFLGLVLQGEVSGGGRLCF